MRLPLYFFGPYRNLSIFNSKFSYVAMLGSNIITYIFGELHLYLGGNNMGGFG